MGQLNKLADESSKPRSQRRSFQFKMRFFCVILAILTVSVVTVSANETSRRPSPGVITTASQIRAMSIEQAKQGRPVYLSCVITYYDPEEPDLFIQDASGGIWINIEVVKPNVPLSAGDLAEMQGVTEAPDFAPQVGNPVFKKIGRAPLPLGRRVSFVEMSSTQEDSQRVEVASPSPGRRSQFPAYLIGWTYAQRGRLRTRGTNPKTIDSYARRGDDAHIRRSSRGRRSMSRARDICLPCEAHTPARVVKRDMPGPRRRATGARPALGHSPHPSRRETIVQGFVG
jgi:hypothetical protein